MLILTPTRCFTTLAVLTLLLAGCGGHSSDEPRAAPAATTGQATVDANGGMVIGPDQVTLSIAPDSVTTNTTFRIARDASQSPPLVGMTLLSPIYAVTPHGSSFDPHALLNLPYDASKVPAGATAVVLRGEPDGSWHVQPNRGAQAGVAVADVGELSWYAVGVCTPGDAGVFGFGLGDCPANHSLTLEYLDGQGDVLPVQRDERGRALPFMPVIEQPTDIALRLTWTRPAGVDRIDSIQLLGPYQAVIAGKPLIGEDVNQALTTRNATGHIDPGLVAGAGDPKGVIVRYKALAEYCWTGFIIGRGDNQRVCWRFDDDIAFRVHDVAPRPDKPIITVQPVNVSVVEGNKASFHVDASGLLKDHSLIRWWRRSDPAKPWARAHDPATPVPGVTLSADGKTLTLTAHQAQDNGTLIRADVCNIRPSGAEGCADDVHEAQLTVTSINGPPTWTGPSDQSVPEHSTVDVLMTAAGIPYATVEIWQLKDGVDTLLKTCTPATVTLKQIGGQLPPNPTVCSLHLPDPALHPADLLLADSGTQFYGKAISDTQANVTSRHATLTVTPQPVAPTITTQPGAITVKLGATATFASAATGSAPLSYQWMFQAIPPSGQSAPPFAKLLDRQAVTSGSQTSGIQGSGSPKLELSNVQTADAGVYQLVVSNGTPPAATSLGATLSVALPPPPPALLAAGFNHTCMAKADGSVYCWGRNDRGQLGNGGNTDAKTPTVVTGLTGVVALSAGEVHTCALLADETVSCWGSNSFGQLGHEGTAPSVTNPIPVTGLTGVVVLAAGGEHTCAIQRSGTVACWGMNAWGQLGDGTKVDKPKPTLVPGLTGVVALAAGADFSCAAKSDGTALCWGRNQESQLGQAAPMPNDGTVSNPVPTLVAGLANVVELSAGEMHACARQGNGTVLCWGSNVNGERGNGTLSIPNPNPGAVTDLNDAAALGSGEWFSCARRASDGSVACWGTSEKGQLGLGDLAFSTVPQTTPLRAKATVLTVGTQHACALLLDNTVWCWGSNNHGQLGDGTTSDQHRPTPVAF